MLRPLAGRLAAAGVNPDHLTIAGLAAACLSGVSLSLGWMHVGLLWLLASGLCDLMDGDVARLMPGRSGRFGAFLDSTVDRVSDAVILTGLLIGKQTHGGVRWEWLLAWSAALSGAFLVSYARARAEGLGLRCTVGIADRSLRLLLVSLLMLLGFRTSGWFLLGIATLSWITVGQRVIHVWRGARTLQEQPGTVVPGALASRGGR